MGKTTIRYSSLVEAGFNKNYFTNFWKSGGGRVYLFCFEQGFYAIPGSNPLKYSLIQWQDYMRDDLAREE
ncbi:MAG: hypothetical protein KDC12_16140 [Flavobacteriales bacterium]|nr:hypothetical protein [Flavobacteriales bacterium]